MRPGKKGEIYSSVIKYILMAFFSLVVLVAGFKGVTFIRDRACNAELANFEIELSGIDKELRFGVKELKDFRIPCKTGQIYFFDLGKKINPDDFNSLPLMKNALATNSSKNIFIVDRGKVKKSFYAGNIEAIYPYYMCLKPKFDRISFFAEGKENSAFLTAACGQPDCTLIPINITESEAQRIIQEAVYSQFGCDKCKYDYALENIKSTKQKVELFRRFIVCNGITKVEIIIKPQKGAEVTNFRYYEYMPKECIDDLNSYLQELELEDNVIVQKNDPLIVWHFDEIEEETVLSYELSKEFGESCKRIIEGLGVVQEIRGAVPPQPVCGDNSCNGLETCSTCPDDCPPCQVALLPQPIIPPVAQPAPTPTIPAQCSGGIPLGCHTDPALRPRKCVALGNGQYGFVNDCQTCNCPSGWNCEGNGDCGAPATSNQCSDGTLRGECSNTKPLECRSNLVLSANAGRCGCPSGERQEDNNCVPDSQTPPTQPQPSQTPTPTPVSSPTCTPNARKGCVGDVIYWFDSCGQIGRLEYDCRRNNIGIGDRDDCKNGECCFSICPPSWLADCCKDSSYYLRNQPPSRSGEDEDREARLSLEFTNINYQNQGGQHYYYHTRVFRETNGVGVTLTNGQLCYASTGRCDSSSVNYRINGNGELIQENKQFNTPSPSDTFTLKYQGTDDNGNPINVEQTLIHPR